MMNGLGDGFIQRLFLFWNKELQVRNVRVSAETFQAEEIGRPRIKRQKLDNKLRIFMTELFPFLHKCRPEPVLTELRQLYGMKLGKRLDLEYRLEL